MFLGRVSAIVRTKKESARGVPKVAIVPLVELEGSTGLFKQILHPPSNLPHSLGCLSQTCSGYHCLGFRKTLTPPSRTRDSPEARPLAPRANDCQIGAPALWTNTCPSWRCLCPRETQMATSCFLALQRVDHPNNRTIGSMPRHKTGAGVFELRRGSKAGNHAGGSGEARLGGSGRFTQRPSQYFIRHILGTRWKPTEAVGSWMGANGCEWTLERHGDVEENCGLSRAASHCTQPTFNPTGEDSGQSFSIQDCQHWFSSGFYFSSNEDQKGMGSVCM